MQPLARAALAVTLVLLAPHALAGGERGVAGGAAGRHLRATFEAYRGFLGGGGKLEDPSLFTAASLVLLARAPGSADAARARLAELEAAAPLRTVAAGDRAALLPRSKTSTTHPVLLERVAGTWRVDLVESAKAFEPGERSGLRLRYEGGPYDAVLALAYPGSGFVELAPVDLFGEDPAAALARLEHATSAASRLRLAEILLRNCWLVDEALPRYEEAVRASPDPWPYARIFGKRALAAGRPDRAIPLLEPHAPLSDDLLARLHARAGRFEASQRYQRRSTLNHLVEKGILEPRRDGEDAPAPGRRSL